MDTNDKPVKLEAVSREEVRRLFPTVVAFADECRKVFGDGVRLTYARENGYEMGECSESDPENTVKLSDMTLDKRPFNEIEEERIKRGK